MSDAPSNEALPESRSHIGAQAQDISFATIAELYKVKERELADIAREPAVAPNTDPEGPPLDFQTDIMDMASKTPARTVEDLYYKMQLWYWDAPDVEDLSYLGRSDRVLLSVIEDLARLSNQSTEDAACPLDPSHCACRADAAQ